MAISISQQGIKQIKRLLKEGLYWEALNLLPGSSMKEIMLRIAELRQSCQGDQEMLVLLSEAKQDLQSGRYPSDRELCDGFFERLGNDFQRSILNEVIITRERIWREYIRQRPNPQSELAKEMLNQGAGLAKDTQERLQAERIGLDTAREAIDKSIHALEIAQIYSDNPEHVAALRMRLGCSLYCNLGVERINRAQEELNSAMDAVQSKTSSGRFDINSLIAEKLGTLSNLDPDVLKHVLSSPDSREALLEALIPGIREAQSHAISEVEAGITDIEEAKRLDSHNQHINDQLKTTRQILENIGGRAQETSFAPQPAVRKPSARPTTVTKTSAAMPYKPEAATSPKRWRVALPLAIFLGWLGADRFYLGRESAGLKLSLFLGWLIGMNTQGFRLVPWVMFAIALCWWIVDIILIARRRLKDGRGLVLH